jgi:hypothetical protein
LTLPSHEAFNIFHVFERHLLGRDFDYHAVDLVQAQFTTIEPEERCIDTELAAAIVPCSGFIRRRTYEWSARVCHKAITNINIRVSSLEAFEDDADAAPSDSERVGLNSNNSVN